MLEIVTVFDREREMKQEGFHIFDVKDKIIICKFCNVRVDWMRRDTCLKHVSNATHKKKKLCTASMSTTGTAKQTSIGDALQTSKNIVVNKQQFIIDFVEMIVGANIPLEKADDPNMRTWLNKYVQGACDPYLKIHLLPEEKFADIASLRTKTHKKTLFPLFDETFTINLEEGLVQFIVKDQDFLGMRNEFIGEAFVPLRSIPRTDATTGLEEMEQMHLKLHRPACLGSETYRALDHRQGDKLARDFVKKEKSKMIYKDPIVPAK